MFHIPLTVTEGFNATPHTENWEWHNGFYLVLSMPVTLWDANGGVFNPICLTAEIDWLTDGAEDAHEGEWRSQKK